MRKIARLSEPLESRSLLATVMTYNLYEGNDFSVLTNLASIEGIPGAVSATWQQVQSSNIPARAEAQAKEIARIRPALVGLQDAAVYTFTPHDPSQPTVTIDSLGLLLQDLNALGEHYDKEVVSPGTTFPPAR